MTGSGDRWYDPGAMRVRVRPLLLLLALGVLWTAGRAGALAPGGEPAATADDCCPETAAADAGADECPPLCTCHCCPHVPVAAPEVAVAAPAAPDPRPLASAALPALPPGRTRPVEYPPER